MDFKITKRKTDNKLVSVDEHIEALKINRERLRASASMFQNISGMLLSAGFIVLFFLIQEKQSKQEPVIYVLMFLAIISLIITTITSLLSVFVRPPTSVITKSEEFYRQLDIYKIEYKWSLISAVFFIIAILLFLTAIVLFAFKLG